MRPVITAAVLTIFAAGCGETGSSSTTSKAASPSKRKVVVVTEAMGKCFAEPKDCSDMTGLLKKRREANSSVVGSAMSQLIAIGMADRYESARQACRPAAGTFYFIDRIDYPVDPKNPSSQVASVILYSEDFNNPSARCFISGPDL